GMPHPADRGGDRDPPAAGRAHDRPRLERTAPRHRRASFGRRRPGTPPRRSRRPPHRRRSGRARPRRPRAPGPGACVRISRASSRVEALGLTRPYTIAFRRIESVDNAIVTLETDSGIRGLGAASPEPKVTGETMEDCRAALEGDRLAWLEGEDPANL